MSEKEQDPMKSDVPGVWPPPPTRLQPMYGDFLQSEVNKVKHNGGELNRLDLLKRLRAEYSLPLEMAVSVLDEFCADYAPELLKDKERGRYILFAIFLWGILFIVAIIRHDYSVCILLAILVFLLSAINMIYRRLRR